MPARLAPTGFLPDNDPLNQQVRECFIYADFADTALNRNDEPMKRYYLNARGMPLSQSWQGKMRTAAKQARYRRGCVVESKRRLAFASNGCMTRPQARFIADKLVAGKAMWLVNLEPRFNRR